MAHYFTPGEFLPSLRLHEALDRLLMLDQARQFAGRDPEGEKEQLASDVIAYLARF